LSGYNRKDRDNETGIRKGNEDSSVTKTICKEPVCRKYSTKSFLGLRNVDVDVDRG
jgi:hypothetical protein